jgi:hydrogenase maturation protease
LNTKSADAIANAVLYEGYMLYPYRPSSVKNRQRFNFGVLYPKSYSEAQNGADACSMQTECLVEGACLSSLEVKVRFLKLVDRSVLELQTSQPDGRISFEPVPMLEVGGKRFVPWQEAIESEVAIPASSLETLTTVPLEWEFSFPAKEETETLHDSGAKIVGIIIRKQEAVRGIVEINATQASNQLLKLQVRVKNLTATEAGHVSRDQALSQSLVSAHILLGVSDGQFVSLLEAPENLKYVAAGCQNIGAWPVLVGNPGDRDTVLASPIILYDYPQIAPESPGDLFDGTEIDEILALRILTMTDEEKREMSSTDDRARAMLERTESLPMEHLMKLHGTLRELRSLKGERP